MFLLTNKALIWVGKGQKRKAHHHLDVGCMGEFGTRDVNQESADQASQSGTRSESLLSYKALIINYKDCFRWWSRW